MKNLFTTLLFLVTMISFSQEIQKRQITTAQIDAIFSQWNTEDKPGISVGILNDGKIVHVKGYGLANLEHQIPVNPETKFHIGDIAKEFTVYALLLLEQRGQLSLEDDIRNYIPKLKPLPHPISIQQLIHHTSGLNNINVSKILAGWNSEDILTKEQAYKLILNQAKSLPNNDSIQQPSDAGFMILEDLITKISKMSYTDFITKEIFKSLGMKNSVFDTQEIIIANKAQGYFPIKDGFVSSTLNPKQTIVSDLYTTVGDMCLWAKELLDPKIGTKQMIKKFDAPSVVNNQEVEEVNIALHTGGHRFWNYRGAKKLYHRELSGGYSSKLIRYPDYNLAVVIMENDGAYNGHFATRASALYIEDYLDSRLNESPKINSKQLSRAELSEFTGDYWDIGNLTTRKIHVSNDTLRYFRGLENESALVPLTKNSFKMITWGNVTVNFNTNVAPKTMNVMVGDDTSHLISYNPNAEWAKNLKIFTDSYYSSTLDTSYSLIIKEGRLILTHPRIDEITLDPRIPYTFSGNRRHFTSLTFMKDANGYIKGFQLSTNGVNDIWFQRDKTSGSGLVKTK